MIVFLTLALSTQLATEERLKMQKEKHRLQEQSADYDRKFGERASEPNDNDKTDAHAIMQTLQEVIFKHWVLHIKQTTRGVQALRSLRASINQSKIQAIKDVETECKKMQEEAQGYSAKLWKVDYDIDTKLFWCESPNEKRYSWYFNFGSLYNIDVES